ncbi:ATP-binding protein [Cronobacter sakazakii]|nr:ATP-binding protein [Cronobacter sakazakii]EJQ1504188.1 ATP-binding protein [Cronobacter sakazakii]EJQ1512855.1 ATP-binding protein [Cronobacter sakazakii]EJQ1519433.1 ATP-binding protein [Cronobacter sakazakii]EJR1111683.1 ATP-binding protein [Cronobacter sakazakii]
MIASHFSFYHNEDKFVRDRRENLEKDHYELKYISSPKKTIAVATSAFDKFPVPKRREVINEYSYLGLRGLPSFDLSSEYISKITFKLISAVLNLELDMSRIGNVLNYLGYYDEIEIQCNSRYSEARLKEIFSSENIYEAFERYFLRGVMPYGSINKNLFINEDGNISKEMVDCAFNAMLKHERKRIGSSGTIIINKNGVKLINEENILDSEFMFLLESGIISTRNVNLRKNNSRKTFSMRNASSGEQCILMSLLGIASQITDNCLICIDEPEVCLHPEWQEKYISILMDTFKDYKNCHFIIATHSPQITSKLNPKNCFILSLHDENTHIATSIINRSIDFQLATLFRAPGYKNEYLTRELVNFLADLTTTSHIDSSKLIEIEKIITLKNLISDTDPVKKLITLAEKAIKEARA